MITVAVDTHTGWLAENGNLYRYLTRHSQLGRSTRRDAIADVKTVIARQLTRVFEFYLAAFDVDGRIAEIICSGVVGLVDSCTAQWLESPRGVTRTELTDLLARWIWCILDDSLQAGGIELDPHQPLPPPPKEPPAGPA